MPRFMDFHEDLTLPEEAVDQIGQGVRDGVTDDFGVRQIDLYHNEQGTVCCLVDAPDEQSVRKHHEALGMPCGHVHRVESLL
jgi:hypothetical protein